MLQKSFYASIAVVSMLASSCSPSKGCRGDGCNKAVIDSTKSDNMISENNGNNPKNPLPGDLPPFGVPTTDAPKAFDALMRLQEMISAVERDIESLTNQNIANLRMHVDAVGDLGKDLETWQAEAEKILQKATDSYLEEGVKLHFKLVKIIADGENSRLALFNQLDAAESALIDLLIPEGTAVLEEWDHKYFAQIDRHREYSRMEELMAIREDMLAAAMNGNSPHKDALKGAIVNLINKNLAQVVANAPAYADRSLLVLNDLEEALEDAGHKPETKLAISDKIISLRGKLKRSLDAFNPDLYQPVDQAMTERDSSKQVIVGLRGSVADFDVFSKQQSPKVASLKEEIERLKIATTALRMKPVVAAANEKLIVQSLAATSRALKLIGKAVDRTNADLKDFVTTTLDIIKNRDGNTFLTELVSKAKEGPLTQKIALIEANQAAVKGAVAQVRESLGDLAAVFDSSTDCALGQVVTESSGLSEIAIQCNRDDYSLLY